MTLLTRSTLCAAALLAGLAAAPETVRFVSAQAQEAKAAPAAAKLGKSDKTKQTKKAPNAAPEGKPSSSKEPPARTPFTAEEDAAAAVPGIPEARFWGDSISDFKSALPAQPGPWLSLSTGGEDGAFGAGLLLGLGASGKRPAYSVVTGASAGALMAPFVFAGPRYDDALRHAYTEVTSADIYEAGTTSESFADSWPLKDLIAKEITPQLLNDIAAEHRSGRRLFIVSYNLDAQRSVVWNMGAIAAHGGDAALNLFRTVLLASTSIPAAFPPVLIDVEANGKRFSEMHVDGGVGGQFFVAPMALMAATSDYKLPATQLTVIVNSGLQPEFEVVERFVPSILTQSVGAAVKVDTRLMLDRAYLFAQRSGVDFKVASIPPSFKKTSRGSFDPDYMKALFQVGFDAGKGDNPFSNQPPPYPGEAGPQPSDGTTSGENR
jgi:predicted acylesterase/phospholipase RssA